jgi:hypothetical protein
MEMEMPQLCTPDEILKGLERFPKVEEDPTKGLFDPKGLVLTYRGDEEDDDDPTVDISTRDDNLPLPGDKTETVEGNTPLLPEKVPSVEHVRHSKNPAIPITSLKRAQAVFYE